MEAEENIILLTQCINLEMRNPKTLFAGGWGGGDYAMPLSSTVDIIHKLLLRNLITLLG